jgi:sodium-dependent phosphate transporter
MNLGQKIWSAMTKGVTIDVASAQSNHVQKIHEKAIKFDDKTEYLYSYLQVCTAAFASFAHGSNDVANAAGPLSGIIQIYQNGTLPKDKVPVPFWLLAFMGISIDLGLILYGYNVMRNLGNNITYHSPTRGFSMELGAAVTVITASFFGLPVSTTHCITGSTIAVGLCNGEFGAINWSIVSWALFSWILTLPIAGLISGGIFKLLISAPHFT